MWYVARHCAAAVEFRLSTSKGDYGMTLSAPTGFSSSDLVFEENFADTALDNYWHSYITNNAANGWPTDSVAATFRSA
jgi:hypothetical protein